MNDLVAGFLKFRETGYQERTKLFHQLAHAQSPGALFIACSDSRIVPELVTQQEPGECSSSAMPATSCLPTGRSRGASRPRWSMR